MSAFGAFYTFALVYAECTKTTNSAIFFAIYTPVVTTVRCIIAIWTTTNTLTTTTAILALLAEIILGEIELTVVAKGAIAAGETITAISAIIVFGKFIVAI